MTSAEVNDPALMTATQLLERYRRGDLSPVEATEAALARIRRHNAELNAYCLVDEETALAAARESETRWQRGEPRGRVDGVPTSVKDLVIAQGWPTRRGSRTTDAAPAEEDAPSVAALRRNGAVLLGKTTTPEFGWKGVTDSALTGITRNPWDPSRTPGGSSGGAAVAAATGMGALHIGTDGGGSVRIPCAFTGIPGMKASFGRVPAYPLSPFASVSHVGPMARSVSDCALMLTVMSEPDRRDPYTLPYDGTDYSASLNDKVTGLRVLFAPTLDNAPVDPEVAELVGAAAARFGELGAAVETQTITLPVDVAQVFRYHWYASAARLFARYNPEMQALIDPGFQEIAREAADFTLLDYLEAVGQREVLTQSMNKLHENYDLLLTPSLPIPAFEAGVEVPAGSGLRRWTEWTPFSLPFNLTGQPAFSLPCGLTKSGLPVGLQIVGPRHADALVLQAAHLLEQVLPSMLPAAATA